MIPTPEQVFARVAGRPGAIWLDGGERGWSVLSWDPDEVVTDARDWPDAGRRLTRAAATDPGVPFSGGVLGYLGYGAGHAVAPVPPEDATPEPPVWLARHAGALCFDPAEQRWHAAGSPSWTRDAEAVLGDAVALAPPPPALVRPGRSVPQVAWEAAVRRILAWLEEGDCYQVDLTRAVHVTDVGADAWSAYRRLRGASPAAFGAFLRLRPDLAILSNSPELFLEVRGDRVRCQPIKGTAPRLGDPADDHASAAGLLASPKDLAELTMIVDLVRNDLGRLARPGSVVTGPRALTSHAHVHHTSQRVEADLKPGLDTWDALARTFPPGSVTGAPKIRACQRIAELEVEPRGVYTGAIGYVADGGDATWSVAIRTAIWAGDAVRYHVGGGIVVASDPTDEWRETEAKGRALAAALHGGGPVEPQPDERRERAP